MSDRSLAAAYATLGLAPGASIDEVKRAWRKAARATHPDLHPEDPDAARRFKAAEAAHALLTDPARVPGAARPFRAGPDEDWIDTCAWIAEAHFLRLRREVLPAYATAHAGGPSLVAALTAAADRGLADAAPTVPPSRWGRLWARRTWRRLGLVVDDGPPLVNGPVGLVQTREGLRIVVWPRVFWAEGVREEDVLRPIVQRSVDIGVAAAAPMVLGVPPTYAGTVATPVPPGADRRWWVAQLFWPVVWTLVAGFSVFLLVNSWLVANAER